MSNDNLDEDEDEKVKGKVGKWHKDAREKAERGQTSSPFSSVLLSNVVLSN